jgi:hypothetical protein
MRAGSVSGADGARYGVQHLEPYVLDVAATLLADAIKALLEALQGFLDGAQLFLRGVVDDVQCCIILQLDCPVRGIRRQRVVAALKILLDPLVPLPERSTPGKERVLDSAEFWLRGHGWVLA